MSMLELDECKAKLADFKRLYGITFGIVNIGIFGSVARRENTEESDIDIVVEVEKPTLAVMYNMKEQLKNLFHCEVDLVRLRDSLRPMLKQNIQEEVIYV